MSNNLQNLIKQFITTKEREGAKYTTLNNYSFYLRRFISTIKISEPEELNYQNVRAFRFKLNKLQLSRTTQNYHLIALRSFLKFLNQENLNNLDPKKISLYPVKIIKKEPLANKEAEKIIQSSGNNESSEIIKKRDLALLESLFSTHLKVSKIAGLKIEDVPGLNLSRQGKYWLKEYLKERKDKTPWLFLRHDRAGGKSDLKPLTPRSIQRIVASYAKNSGLRKKVTPESFTRI